MSIFSPEKNIYPSVISGPTVYQTPTVYNKRGVYNGYGVYDDSKDKIKIGENFYKYTEINGYLWITENLHERLENVELIYPNNSLYNERLDGLLYRAYDVFNYVIQILPDGWKVPTVDDFKTLENGDINKIANYYVGENQGGLNNNGLNLRLNGYRGDNGTFSWYGEYVSLWTSTFYSSDRTKVFEGRATSRIDLLFANSYGNATQLRNTASALRVCRKL